MEQNLRLSKIIFTASIDILTRLIKNLNWISTYDISQGLKGDGYFWNHDLEWCHQVKV